MRVADPLSYPGPTPESWDELRHRFGAMLGLTEDVPSAVLRRALSMRRSRTG